MTAAPPPSPPAPRSALLAGATGLVGAELLTLLQASPRYGQVHALVRRPGPRPDGKLQFHTVDFTKLPKRFPRVDDVYIALGTTIMVAGSEAAFRQVDFDFVVATATAARAGGARRLAIVSALGADPKSAVFYNRVKGEMQAAVAQLGYDSIVIAQPSLLLGNRTTLGQPERRAEVWAARFVRPVMWLVPKTVRPITAAAVAQALLNETLAGHAGLRFLSSKKMQPT